MTLLSKDQITQMSLPELEKEIQKCNKEVRNLGMQLRTHQSQDHETYENAKKNRARLMTEYNTKKQNN